MQQGDSFSYTKVKRNHPLDPPKRTIQLQWLLRKLIKVTLFKGNQSYFKGNQLEMKTLMASVLSMNIDGCR